MEKKYRPGHFRKTAFEKVPGYKKNFNRKIFLVILKTVLVCDLIFLFSVSSSKNVEFMDNIVKVFSS